jgi:hypothetical protein
MKRAAFILAICLPLAPLQAQEASPNADVEEGMGLLEQGAQLLMRGMMAEMEPALKEMADAFTAAEPMLRDLIAIMGDAANYHAPVILPNGDILIRRRLPGADVPGGEIEL